MSDKKTDSFQRLLSIMDRLRVECPWDREQTFDSLRNNTIEETYELVDAITDGDMKGIREELGDLMLHVVFYSKMGEEQNSFDISDVMNGVCDKLIFRHPHVFGDVDADTAGVVKQNWEQLKLKEGKKRKGVLGGVPKSLPAMVKAYRISEKAAAAGFDWEQKEDVWAKVREELSEVETEMQSGNQEAMNEEFGDVLFALINVARKYGIDPEMALEKCNKKFIKRFNHVEQRANEQDKAIRDFSLSDLDAWWNEAKQR